MVCGVCFGPRPEGTAPGVVGPGTEVISVPRWLGVPCGCPIAGPDVWGTFQCLALGETGVICRDAGILVMCFCIWVSGRTMALAGRAAPGTPRCQGPDFN